VLLRRCLRRSQLVVGTAHVVAPRFLIGPIPPIDIVTRRRTTLLDRRRRRLASWPRNGARAPPLAHCLEARSCDSHDRRRRRLRLGGGGGGGGVADGTLGRQGGRCRQFLPRAARSSLHVVNTFPCLGHRRVRRGSFIDIKQIPINYSTFQSLARHVAVKITQLNPFARQSCATRSVVLGNPSLHSPQW
jgi:hypothetical protein